MDDHTLQSFKTQNSKFNLEVRNLGKRFNRDWIFKDLTYTFTSGNTYAITGPNGSGKSTLLQILWGQLPQSTGEVQYANSTAKIELDKIHTHISIATPYMDLIDEFTLTEQLLFHFKLRKSRNGMGIGQVLELMNLEHARDKVINNFSSGMKQRVKLALAFFTQADFIFLDEPGTNLDEQAFKWFQKQLHELPKDCIVFIASNQKDEYPDDARKLDLVNYK